MTALSNLIQEFGVTNDSGLTHRKPFLNSKSSSGRSCWYNRRRYV
ncbi:hypothetical protein [Christiangramia sp. SM2212]|uniref:Uncharacterized protein n=1 Tax=Christiangramia sediminicola TaxID=3073267 RepID=A0ABU1EP87_9FLAO|nr:hypothetical protein [Christiangramia sp. SM2212]MDR5590194.1 hypothetical protein [Christiangramia sp. SM2212]